MAEGENPDRQEEEAAALRREIARLRAALDRLGPDLATWLRIRGFRVYRKEPAADLLRPAARFLDGYYDKMKKYSFRLFLREVINHQELFAAETVSRFAGIEAAQQYLEYILAIGLAVRQPRGCRLCRPIRSFGDTLEWFLAELCCREFGAEAIWGVKFKRAGIGGDYDLLARIDGLVLYMEVKSSPPKQVGLGEIAAFLARADDLGPGLAIFFMDTELRMQDKIVPMFAESLWLRTGRQPAVRRLTREIYVAADRYLIMNARPEIAANLETVLAWRSRQNF